MSDFAKLIEEFKGKLSKARSSKEVETIRLAIFGKNGLINLKFKTLASLSADQKAAVQAASDKYGIPVSYTHLTLPTKA